MEWEVGLFGRLGWVSFYWGVGFLSHILKNSAPPETSYKKDSLKNQAVFCDLIFRILVFVNDGFGLFEIYRNGF